MMVCISFINTKKLRFFMKNVYLDNAATTSVSDAVFEVMKPYFIIEYGNASCLHNKGQKADDALNKARKIISDKINAEPEEIIFTSSGTESNNLAIKGIAYSKQKGHIITSQFEHPAVLNVCRDLEKNGFEVDYVKVDKNGFIDLNHFKSLIKENTILVSIMHANNEIGTVQDIREIGKICKEKHIVFHTDAVQSFSKVEIDVKKDSIDLASFSAHKIHGPKGVGALYIKKGTKIQNLFNGGSQEFGLRPGTENIPGIVGFAEAVRNIKSEDIENMKELRDYFISELLKIDKTSLNGSRKSRLCNNISVSFHNTEGESILISLDEKGIAVSTSSACTSSKLEQSHVLKAIGLKPEDSHGTVRFTLSRYTTKEEIDYTLECLKKIVERLRGIAPK